MTDSEKQQPTVVIADPELRTWNGGFTSIPNRVLENNALSLGARMTFAMLLKYAWQKDFCWPAQESLAKHLGCSDRSIRRWLRELSEAGLVTWKQQGLTRPALYTIHQLPEAIDTDDNAPDSTPDKNVEPSESLISQGPDNMSGQDRTLLPADPSLDNLATQARTAMSAQARTLVSDKEDSKKNTHSVTNVNVMNEQETEDDDLRAAQKAREEEMFARIIEVCRDRQQSGGCYRLIARNAPPDHITTALADTKSALVAREVKKTAGAYFIDLMKHKAVAEGYDLGIGTTSQVL